MTCTTFQIVIGPKNESSCGRTCQILIWIFSTLITYLFRIVILIFCIYQNNSIVVTLYPSSNIYLNNSCSDITAVTGYLSYDLYNKSEQANLYYGENNLLMSDENNYVIKHFYCGDITMFLNTLWIPFITWFTLIILPQLLLSTIAFIIMFRSKSFSILLQYPGFTLISLVSHHNLGPTSWRRTSPGLIHSQILTYFNIVLTFLGVCVIIHLTTTGFGNGDGSQLIFALTVFISIPMFMFSGILALVFMHGFHDCGCCCNLQRRVFNPQDPGKLGVLGYEESFVEVEKI